MNTTLYHIPYSNSVPDELLALYNTSFPADERRPVDSILSLIDNHDSPFNAYVIKADNGFAGFITTWDFDNMLYVEHFATNPELRGQGIGSDALNMLMELADKPVVLEVEPEDSNPLASRRIGFYRRHGFMLHSDYKYIQPPYTPESQSIEMKLMSSAAIDPDRARTLLYKHVYRAE